MHKKTLPKLLIVAIIAGALGYMTDAAWKRHQLNSYRYEEVFWQQRYLDKMIRKPAYLARDQYFPLPDPPKNASRTTKNELAYLKELEQKRDDKTIDLILFEGDPEVRTVSMMANSNIIAAELMTLPEVHHMLREAYKRVSPFFIIREKQRYSRPRPSHLDRDLHLLIPNPAHPAYPSGHATEAHMIAHLLGALFPEQEQGLTNYAGQIAHRREIAGLHYPSDSAAGKLLGKQIAETLLKHPDFQQHILKAKSAIALHNAP